LAELPFQHLTPDKDHNWLNLSENSWEDLLPVATKQSKLAKSSAEIDAIFELYSLGVMTARDEWVYGLTVNSVEQQIKYFIDIYNKDVNRLFGNIESDKIDDNLNYSIKWTRAVKNDLSKGKIYTYQRHRVIDSLYRPFVGRYLYFSKNLNEMQYQLPDIIRSDNLVIAFSGTGSSKPFSTLATNKVFNHDLLEKTQCLPLYRYDGEGNRRDNITDFALARFRERYEPSPPNPLSQGEKGSQASPQPSPRERGSQPSPQPSPKGRGSFDFPLLPLGEGAGGEGVVVGGEGVVAGAEGVVAKRKPALPPEFLERVRELRKNATNAEKLLWQLLRNRQVGEAKFRRQHPFGKFILDFYCHEAKLALELDGSGHAEPKQAQYDMARTQALESEGIRVLRFWNNDVFENTIGVLETIFEAVQPSPPSPLSQREKGSQDFPPLSLGEGVGGEGAVVGTQDTPSPQPSPFGRGSQDAPSLQLSPLSPNGDKEKGSQDFPLLPLGEGAGGEGAVISKLDIFHYVYAVLHDPAYRAKYELNLKRELPRIPFYDDFWQWAAWGQRLMELHVNFESVAPYPLERKDKTPSPQPSPKGRGSQVDSLLPLGEGLGSQVDSLLPLGEGLGVRVTPKLKADKERNIIEIDSETTLHGVPAVAWEYKLGNRSALEWVLDRYKEKTPSDPTIAEKFNNYRFADYKADVITLLGRVCTVSVETMRIVAEMSQ